MSERMSDKESTTLGAWILGWAALALLSAGFDWLAGALVFGIFLLATIIIAKRIG